MTNNQAALTYYEQLRQSSPVELVQLTDSLNQNQTDPLHQQLNEGWAKALIPQKPKKFVLKPFPQFSDPPSTPIQTDPTDTDEINNSHEIQQSKVESFLATPRMTKITDVKPFSQFSKPLATNPFSFSIPEETLDFECLIGVELKKIILPTFEANTEYFGTLQLISKTAKKYISEPVFFKFTQINVTFSQTNQSKVFFQIRNQTDDIFLFCYLHKLSKDSPNKTLMAFNIAPLFNTTDFIDNIAFSDKWKPVAEFFEPPSPTKNDPSPVPQEVKIRTEMAITHISDKEAIQQMKFSYTWRPLSNDNLVALPIEILPTTTTPIASLYQLRLVLNNPPKNSLLYFKAIVVNGEQKVNAKDSETTLKGLKVFPTPDGQLTDAYISATAPSINCISVLESMRIFINWEDIRRDTHIIFFIMSRDLPTGKKEKKPPKDKVYKVGIIPLRNEKAELTFQRQINLWDFGKVPKGYLEPQKKEKMKKTFLEYHIVLPPIYYSHSYCSDICKIDINHADPLIVSNPQFHLSNVIFPILSHILSQKMEFSGFDNLLQILDAYLNEGDPKLSVIEKRKEQLSYWLFTSFDPSICQVDFICEIIGSHLKTKSEFIRKKETIDAMKQVSQLDDKKDKSNKKKLEQLDPNVYLTYTNGTKAIQFIDRCFNHLKFFFDLITVCLVSKIPEYKLNTTIVDTPMRNRIVTFFTDFSKSLYHPKRKLNDLVEAYIKTFYLVYPFFTANEIAHISTRILQSFTSYVEDDPNSSDPSQPNKEKEKRVKLEFIKFGLYFLKAISTTPAFFVAAAANLPEFKISQKAWSSLYSGFQSQISLLIYNLFKYDFNDMESRKRYADLCDFISYLPPQLESIQDAEARHQVITLFLSTVEIITENFDKIKDHNLKFTLIPFIILVLNESDEDVLKTLFGSTPSSSKDSFILFLASLMTVVNEQNNQYKYNYIEQISKRILNFLLLVINNYKTSMDNLVELLKVMIFENKYQTALNYPYFYNFISQVMELYLCNRFMVNTLANNIQTHQHSMRCLCTSLLSCQIYCDYKLNNDIVRSSLDMLDSLTTILWKLTPEEIELYKVFLNLLYQLDSRYKNQAFENLVKERIDAAMIIAESIIEQMTSNLPHEAKCHQTMKIADQYKAFPSMRIKWLQQILSINIGVKNYLSAFITQLHIISLVTTVYDYMKEHKRMIGQESTKQEEILPDPPTHLMIVRPLENSDKRYTYTHPQIYLDFNFHPELVDEINIPFKDFQESSFELLGDFDFDMLEKEMVLAFDLGMKADLPYTLRPLASLLIRWFYNQRNFVGMGNACKSLQLALNGISTKTSTLTHDIDIQFYLVERHEQSKQPIREVYCVRLNQNVEDGITKNLSLGNLESNYKKSDTKVLDEPTDDVFIQNISSKERFGDLSLNICEFHGTNQCKSTNEGVCILRLQPTDNFPLDNEDPHYWSHFQTRVTPKLIINNNQDANSTIPIVVLETKDAAPHYKMTITVSDYNVELLTRVEIVKKEMFYYAAVLDLLSDNLETYFEVDDPEMWGVTPNELYSREFVEKIGILVSMFLPLQPNLQYFLTNKLPEQQTTAEDFVKSIQLPEKPTENVDEVVSMKTLINALRINQPDEAEQLVKDIMAPSLTRALLVFLRAKKDLMPYMDSPTDKFDRKVNDVFGLVNQFLGYYNQDLVDKTDFYTGKENQVSQTFKFEKQFD